MLVFETTLEKKREEIYLSYLLKIFPKASLLATNPLSVSVGMFILSFFIFWFWLRWASRHTEFVQLWPVAGFLIAGWGPPAGRRAPEHLDSVVGVCRLL